MTMGCRQLRGCPANQTLWARNCGRVGRALSPPFSILHQTSGSLKQQGYVKSDYLPKRPEGRVIRKMRTMDEVRHRKPIFHPGKIGCPLSMI